MTKLLPLLLVGLLISCAARRGAGPPRPIPGLLRPSGGGAGQQGGPERAASASLVEEGQRALERGLYDRSVGLFQESVTVDPSNGIGFYYLAVVKLRTGEYGEVWGLLEKAESLLVGDPEWALKLEELKRELNQKKLD